MKSVVICGSKKFKDEISKFCAELEKLAVMVFEPSIQQPIFEDEKIGNDYVTSVIFKGLTLEHFGKIRKADVCFIYNKNDYVGVSVTLEMGYAVALGKPVFALSDKTGDPLRDVLIDNVFSDAKSLAKIL